MDKIEDNESKWTIENFQYNTGVNNNITYPHCWKCVTVNKCWFKNESNKKPEEFDYSFTGISKKLIGLYHPRCHCKKLANDVPKIKEIIILDVRSKFNDFFKRKVFFMV